MRVDRVRPFRRALAFATATALATTGLAACGGGDDDAQTVDISVTEKGKASEITAPESVEAGLTEITLTNNGKTGHDMTLIRLEGDRSAADAVQGLAAAIEGKPFPEWFFAGGGVSVTAPGKSRTVTQVLQPGTYYAFDTEQLQGPPDPKTVPAIEVTGEASDDELPEAESGEIQTIDYGFKASGLKAGNNEFLFTNAGAQPHFIEAQPLKEGATIEDVEKAFKSNGQPPLEEQDVQTTAVLEGGDSQLVTLNLKPGKYALLCFISDRQGGPPHSIGKGMIGVAEVE
jgi:hypothetical protein